MCRPRTQHALDALGAGLLVGAAVWIRSRPPERMPAMGLSDHEVAADLALTGGVIALVVGLAWLARTTWLVVAVRRAVSRLRPAAWTGELTAAVGRVGVGGVRCVLDDARAAFCAGVLRPRVYVTTGLTRSLGPDELEAVLWHERRHARRRDPLRRAALRAAAEVLLCAPVLVWWSRRHLEAAELAADRAAIRRLGPGPVARALAATATPASPELAAPFDGAAAARVAQLLGEEPPRRRLSAAAVPLSVGRVAVAVNLGALLAQAGLRVLG